MLFPFFRAVLRQPGHCTAKEKQARDADSVVGFFDRMRRRFAVYVFSDYVRPKANSSSKQGSLSPDNVFCISVGSGHSSAQKKLFGSSSSFLVTTGAPNSSQAARSPQLATLWFPSAFWVGPLHNCCAIC